MWYVDFLQLNNGHIYVGHTHDLKDRVTAHEAGEVTSTRPHRPLKLKSYVAVETPALAGRLELYFKSGSGKAVALKRFIE